MAVTKVPSRQTTLVATLDITYVTLGAAITTGLVVPLVDLPYGAIVTGGHFVVTTTWVGPTVCSLDLGDAGNDDRYTSTIINLLSDTYVALTPTGYKYTAADAIDGTSIQSVAVATAGAGTLVVEYIIDDRATETMD